MTAAALHAPAAQPRLRLALGALGVVFGDIGTSPIYAFRESFIGPSPLPIDNPDVVVQGYAVGMYQLFLDRRLDLVSIEGDHYLLERLLDVAPTPIDA